VTLNWTRSSFCDSSACILVAHDGDLTYLRDTETGVIIKVNRPTWDAFERGVVAGEFRRDTVGE
jgi:hypothetical protein